MATEPSLNPQVIGHAENALRALLERTLAGTGLAYRHWIALSLTVGNNVPVDQDKLIDRITGVLKVDDTTVREMIADCGTGCLVAHVIDAVPDGALSRWPKIHRCRGGDADV